MALEFFPLLAIVTELETWYVVDISRKMCLNVFLIVYTSKGIQLPEIVSDI